MKVEDYINRYYIPNKESLFDENRDEYIKYLKNPDQYPDKIKNFEDERKRREENAAAVFKGIPLSNEESVKITYDDICSDIEKEFANEGVIADFCLGGLYDLIFKDLEARRQSSSEEMESIFLETEKSFVDRTSKKMEGIFSCQEIIKKHLPTFYIFIVYSTFKNRLKKPSSYSLYSEYFPQKRKGKQTPRPFSINISKLTITNFSYNTSKEIQYIKISHNFLEDFRIALQSLHYCHYFRTCDEAQAALIIYLFPEYAEKVRWYNPSEKKLQLK